MRKSELEIESLNAWRALEKLSRAQIAVLSARRTENNRLFVQVRHKDVKKAFAIFRGSCYNIKKVRPRGFSRVLARFLKSAGMLAGALVFALSVVFAETRILRIQVTGSGAYYADEVTGILARNGVKRFGGLPADSSPVTAEILSLPRVSFCSVEKRGGVLTVTVEVTDENAVLESEPLISPVGGTVEELVVIRGTAVKEIGATVSAGDVLVNNESAVEGKTYRVIVIARARIAYPFSGEYGGTEENAKAQAEIEFGTIKEIHTAETDRGWLVTGRAVKEISLNLE